MGSKGLIRRGSRWRRLSVLALLWVGGTLGTPAACLGGTAAMGRTSSASMTISVDVVPRFTLTTPAFLQAASALRPMAAGKPNEFCFESNSTMPFTVAQETADGSWIARPTTAALRAGTLFPAACVTLAGGGADAATDPARAKSPAPAPPKGSVTLLIAPL